MYSAETLRAMLEPSKGMLEKSSRVVSCASGCVVLLLQLLSELEVLLGMDVYDSQAAQRWKEGRNSYSYTTIPYPTTNSNCKSCIRSSSLLTAHAQRHTTPGATPPRGSGPRPGISNPRSLDHSLSLSQTLLLRVNNDKLGRHRWCGVAEDRVSSRLTGASYDIISYHRTP